MATFENVEKLRERANVTYEEAKQALESCNDDLLDAMIYLEAHGKVAPPVGGGRYSSAPPPSPADMSGGTGRGYRCHEHKHGESFGQMMKRFGRFLKRLLEKGNANLFEVWQSDENIITVPLTVLVLLLVFCFWLVIPSLVIGLFFGCHYRFRGREMEKTGLNKAMDSASNAAENIKRDFNTKSDDGDAE